MPDGPLQDGLIDMLTGLGGLGLTVFEAGGDPSPGGGAARVAVDRAGRRPDADAEAFDILLSADPEAPAPWVGLTPDRLDETLTALTSAVDRQPIAAAVAAQVHRMTLKLSFADALALESLAYSMLLASAGFRDWRTTTPVRQRAGDTGPRVRLSREAGALMIRLARPDVRNAFDTRMRDELAEALDFALEDPDHAPVILSAEGPSFSAGGDLDAFGQAADPARAHAIRLMQSATERVHRLGARITARLHGACVGAGIEIPAAAARVVARPGASFRLPEVSMGLIPGAGGTASIPRRIGRHRACYLAISGQTLDLQTALAWGLVDAVDDGP